MTTSASSQSGNPKSRRTCVCHRRVTPTCIITTFIVITCSSDFVPIVGGNDCCFLKVVTPSLIICWIQLSLAVVVTIIFRESLPVIKVSVVIIDVIAFATSIADDSPDQIYFSPGHQAGRFRSLVSANGQGSNSPEFQDISFHSAVSLCTDPKFYPDKTEVRTFFFTKNCVCDTGQILTHVENVLITNKSHVP